MTILEKIKFEEDWLSEVNLTKENIKIAFAGIRATALEQQPCENCTVIKKLSKKYYIEDAYGYTDENIVNKVNEIIDVVNELSSVTPKPFINKPCISEGVCREDKIQVLDKIRAEIENMEIVYDKSPNYEDDRTDEEKAIDWFNMHKFLFLQIIDKYKGESEG